MGAVSWLQLGAALAAIAGAAAAGLGLLAIFASGMASAPDDGTARRGCLAAIFGLLLIGLSIWGLTR